MSKEQILDRIFELREKMSYMSNTDQRAKIDAEIQRLYRMLDSK